MESKKNNYNKPATLVVKIQQRGQLLDGGTGDPQETGGGNAREHRSDWGSED